MKDQLLLDAAAAELATVVGALLETSAAAQPGGAGIAQVVAELKLEGPITRSLVVGLPREGAAALARGVMALTAPPDDAALADTLKEVCGQAVGALAQRADLKGLRLGECTLRTMAPAGAPVIYRLTAGDRLDTVLCLWAEAGAGSAEQVTAAASSRPTVPPANLDVILDIDLPLTVRFGETEMTLQALTRLAPGSVIDLGRSPEEAVDVLVNGRLIARGEVVVVSGNYGVRISEVISPADRLRTVAA